MIFKLKQQEAHYKEENELVILDTLIQVYIRLQVLLKRKKRDWFSEY